MLPDIQIRVAKVHGYQATPYIDSAESLVSTSGSSLFQAAQPCTVGAAQMSGNFDHSHTCTVVTLATPVRAKPPFYSPAKQCILDNMSINGKGEL